MISDGVKSILEGHEETQALAQGIDQSVKDMATELVNERERARSEQLNAAQCKHVSKWDDRYC